MRKKILSSFFQGEDPMLYFLCSSSNSPSSIQTVPVRSGFLCFNWMVTQVGFSKLYFLHSKEWQAIKTLDLDKQTSGIFEFGVGRREKYTMFHSTWITHSTLSSANIHSWIFLKLWKEETVLIASNPHHTLKSKRKLRADEPADCRKAEVGTKEKAKSRLF